jgi:hypothetical protein
MRRLFASVLVLTSMAAVPPRSGPPRSGPPLPWIDTGHKLIALVAWADLTPPARARVAALLAAHPRYQEDLLAGSDASADADSRNRHAFAVASTWPDLVRSQQHPMHAEHDHPVWHYIDLPFVIGDVAVPERKAGEGPRDVVAALAQVAAVVRDDRAAAADRAIALCWLLHLVGDVHQPLHACECYSAQFPKGDQGGNAIVVLRDPPYTNSQMSLHLLWDSLPGNYKADRTLEEVVTGLRADPVLAREKLRTALGERDFGAWAKESHALAVEYAYLDGHLVGREAHAQRGEGRGEGRAPGVPEGYVEKAEKVAMQRVALAGYRLADFLNAAFDKP